MGIMGTSNKTISNQINEQNKSTFKTVNNLLTLQENHVEEYFQYHGIDFLTAFEQLIEDVVKRVLGEMLPKMELQNNNDTGKISVTQDCLSEYSKITQENIDLDIQALLASAVNSEVIMQRKMAKQQYLETQGYSGGGQSTQQPVQNQNVPQNIQGTPMGGQMNQNMYDANNQSGYPVAPAGYDQYNNPYWIDPQTGQATFQAPSSGLHLMQKAQKIATWAKWLA